MNVKVNITIFFTLGSFFYSLLLIFAFFSKSKLKSKENSIYAGLICINFFGIILEILCCIFAGYFILYPNFYTILNRLFLVYLITWNFVFAIYVFYISLINNVKEKKLKRISKLAGILYIVFIFLVLIFPVEFMLNDGYVMYSYGKAVDCVYLFIGIAMFSMVTCLLKNYKNLKSKKYLPLYIFMILGAITSTIQTLFPEFLLATSVETFITMIMFFTIENPDMKLLEEVHRSKEISDNANEEKTLFLYNMTQEIRNTANEIDDNADMILDIDKIDEIKNYAREIKRITSKFNSMTNEVLDISKLDSSNIKVYNSKYNIKNILKEVVTMYTNTCKDKNIKFRVNIDHDIPDILYGDSIGLKEVLTIIMDNSVKYTKEGFIEFSVNTIIKNDVCRLIVTIEDSGIGIKSEDINKMKIDNKSLNKANNLITLMNGTMMISSNYGLGTKVKVILDQKIEFNVNEDVAKYDLIYDDVKLLMVDDSDSGIKIIEKLIKGSNIKMDFATNGKDCVDKIKAYKNYDIILLDEQLSQISAIELMDKIKSIRNFSIPVILLTKDNSYEYNDEYKNLGFNGYLLKPVKKEELLNKIKECAKKDN
ncbi:MAG: response regulator [Bacilli bacterium]|nr:response regulator [Bacilli bacterium]